MGVRLYFPPGSGSSPVGLGTPLQYLRTNAAGLATEWATLPTFPSGAIVGTTDVQTLTNKSLVDATTYIIDDADNTKIAKFQCSGITTGTTRTFTFPDVTDTIVVLTANQTLTNKTLTTPNIAAIHPSGGSATLTFPDVTDTVVGKATTDTLTNKTINGANNTLTVRLANDVSGTLPIANGGNGNAGGSSALGALAIDWAVAPVFTKTLSAGSNTFTFSNASDGMCIVVVLTGAASTVVWPTVKWPAGSAPVQTASGTDVYTFVKANGTIYGSVVQAMA
jgi:hypothetical protein